MLKPAAAWPFPAKGKSEEAILFKEIVSDRLAELEQIERTYKWLMDCARKTGVIVTFRDGTMQVIHGTTTDAVDALLDSCKTIDTEYEHAGVVSADAIDAMRKALAGAA